jgi:nucleotide-binding universal stress UspA family protein
MVMNKVLIAVDGSPTAESALGIARELLAGKQVTIMVLHVIPQHTVFGRGGAGPAETYNLSEVRAASEALVEKSASTLRETGLGASIQTRVVEGDPAEMILTFAEELDADLIVLGSRGLTAARRFLVGSVSTRVATHASCAVLVVHPKHARKS